MFQSLVVHEDGLRRAQSHKFAASELGRRWARAGRLFKGGRGVSSASLGDEGAPGGQQTARARPSSTHLVQCNKGARVSGVPTSSNVERLRCGDDMPFNHMELERGAPPVQRRGAREVERRGAAPVLLACVSRLNPTLMKGHGQHSFVHSPYVPEFVSTRCAGSFSF